MTDYRVDKGIIYSENGLPCTPRWFCNGRVAFEADSNEIRDIDYFNPTARGHYKAFHARLMGGIRFFVRTESDFRKIRAEKCEILPFGYKSVSKDGELSLYTFDDAVFISFKPSVTDAVLQVEFYEEFLFYPEPQEHGDMRYRSNIRREWDTPSEQNGTLFFSFAESDGSKTGITVSGNTALMLSETPRNKKYIITPELCDVYTVAIAFSSGERRIVTDYADKLKKQFERYNKVADIAPVLKSKNPALNDFFKLAPMYHESLKTIDVCGAIRAQSTHYWVWGWDSMTSNECCIYWGDREFIGEMLGCMMKYADESGISHAFSQNMKCGGVAAPPAQGMYITLLDLYRLSGGDYKKYFDFAKSIYIRILDTEVRDTGLCKGTSLYPDFRNLIKETGNDISCFNNTASYCAIRSMEALAKAFGDKQTEKSAQQFAERMRDGFENILYNKEYEFFNSSVDADTYERRNVLSNNAVKWENSYCGELVGEKAEECLRFYEDKLISRAGIRPLAVDDDCYNADANQLSCWWPVMSEFYTRLINKYDKVNRMDQFVGWIEYWTKKLMCPEGISCYDNNAEVSLDNWNCLSGIWHGYSIRGFYNAVVHSVVGVDFNESGINFHPYSGEEIELDNLHFGDMKFNIRMLGSGKRILSVILNEENIGSVYFVPFDKLKNINDIIVDRG